MKVSARGLFNQVTAAYGGTVRALFRGGSSPWPLFVSCFVTYDCNLSCPFCLARGARHAYCGPTLSPAQWGEIFRQIPSITLLGFSGGEALCHPRIGEILGIAAAGHRIALVTNGVALDDPVAADLAALGAKGPLRAGLVQVGVSINEPLADERACRDVLAGKLAVLGRIARERRRLGRRFPLLELKVLVRDDTAPHLAVFAEAARDARVDEVTFQMLNAQRYAADLGLDPADRPSVEALRRYHDTAPGPVAFTRTRELRESLARLASLPAAHAPVVFQPGVSPEQFAAHYEGRMDMGTVGCINPWVHVLIDPGGVAYQCFNAEGVDLKATPFRTAWNTPGFRAFRRELRRRRIFPCCAGCCFLRAL
jgi:MoaA/NifB/PqqE/SkfB family radical SAM enzyme